ncbi:hypothetical protein [Endozoicomonas ascidiicola]|uniref:hypothetical protein n=1 Tax=Endozoicomonas ascidiicola TaxID=1698521 RepID=UPI00155F675B|nr:hypothetical protein [Endozoicomonas ascidiicola]
MERVEYRFLSVARREGVRRAIKHQLTAQKLAMIYPLRVFSRLYKALFRKKCFIFFILFENTADFSEHLFLHLRIAAMMNSKLFEIPALKLFIVRTISVDVQRLYGGKKPLAGLGVIAGNGQNQLPFKAHGAGQVIAMKTGPNAIIQRQCKVISGQSLIRFRVRNSRALAGKE